MNDLTTVRDNLDKAEALIREARQLLTAAGYKHIDNPAFFAALRAAEEGIGGLDTRDLVGGAA